MEDMEKHRGTEYSDDIEELVDMILLEDGCDPVKGNKDRNAIKAEIEADIDLLRGVLAGEEEMSTFLEESGVDNKTAAVKNDAAPLKNPTKYHIECVRKKVTVTKNPEKNVFHLMQQVFHYEIYLVSSSNPA